MRRVARRAHLALAIVVLAVIAGDAGQARLGLLADADRAPVSAALAPVSDTASPGVAASPSPAGSAPSASGSPDTPPGGLVVPDLVATIPSGFTDAQLAEIAALDGVRLVMPVYGGQLTVNGKPASVLGVSPAAFRSWTPPVTAANAGIWTALASGDLIASQAAAHRLALTAGTVGQVSGAASMPLLVAATTLLGLPGADAIVDPQRAAQLGLAASVAALINAPGADLTAVMQQIRSLIGPTGRVANLVPIVTTVNLPVITTVPAGVPTNYLTLYQDSAAEYCPSLSWTVLAAIGQIESDHGTNDGPSSAGALGPMQFLPATWAVWGTDGFGQTGPANIMNPLDAVPSAARMLCADGAAAGGASLSAAIYDYNHADWYVSEVLDLAEEYAQEYH